MAGEAAFGTLLKLGAATIANVTSISGPSMGAETIDVTAHDSSGNYREMVPSFLTAGEVSVDLNFDPDGATHKNVSGGVIYEMTTRNAGSWSITFTDGTVASFTAYVTAFEPDAPFDDKLSASMTLTISGAVTWT